MKSEVKAAWVKALRSGRYKQVAGALKCEGGHCCLGVLSELHRKNAKDAQEWVKAEPGKLFSDIANPMAYGKPKQAGLPPKRVYTWAGLHHTTGGRLAEMNDCGKSFKEIADYIEENL